MSSYGVCLKTRKQEIFWIFSLCLQRVDSTVNPFKKCAVNHFILHCNGWRACTQSADEGSNFLKHSELIAITWSCSTINYFLWSLWHREKGLWKNRMKHKRSLRTFFFPYESYICSTELILKLKTWLLGAILISLLQISIQLVLKL